MRYRKCYDLREMWYNLMLMLNSFYCIRSCYNGIIAVSTCPVLPEMHVKFIYQRTVIVVVALPESTYLPCEAMKTHGKHLCRERLTATLPRRTAATAKLASRCALYRAHGKGLCHVYF